jgi:phage baseplate assembly protein V
MSGSERAARRSALSIAPAGVALVDDAGDHQALQLEPLDDEVLDAVPRVQEYGLASYPKAGAQAVFVAALGSRDAAIVVVVGDHRYRLKGLEEGEVALYDDQGQVILLARDGIHVTTPLDFSVNAGGNMALHADGTMAITSTGALTVNGSAVNLGGAGGAGVARIGDAVAGGVITGGSTKVKAT